MGIFGGKFTNLNTNISNKENQEANCIHPKYYAEKIRNHSEVQAKGKGNNVYLYNLSLLSSNPDIILWIKNRSSTKYK